MLKTFTGIAGDFDTNTYVLIEDYRRLEKAIVEAHDYLREGAIRAAESALRRELPKE